MEESNQLYVVLVVLILLVVPIVLYFFSKKEEEEIDKSFSGRLDDEFFYDKDTGTKITLEEIAENGFIQSVDQINRIKTDEEIKQFFSEEEWEEEYLLNDMKRRGFTYLDFLESELEELQGTALLGQYENWTYTRPFELGELKLRVCFLDVQNYYLAGKGSGTFNFKQLLFWVKILALNGHYLLVEKSFNDKILSLIEGEEYEERDNFFLKTLRASKYTVRNIDFIDNFNEIAGIEIEIWDENMFIKTKKMFSYQEFELVLSAIQKSLVQTATLLPKY
jgi:hypothetical protein